MFLGSTVTYSGHSPAVWNNNNNGTITLRYSYSANAWKHTTINIGSSFAGGPLYQFYIDVQPANGGLLDPSLSINNLGQSLSVAITDEDSEAANGIRRNDGLKWNLMVSDVATGRQMYSGIVEGLTKTVDISGWPSGVYIVSAQSGEIAISQKIVIN